tara:strand:+ start:2451 stop:3047 length:597 start_codon:yes stop_codon:yes gene_type:complete
MKRGGKVKKRYNRGGLAVGPSHEQGGIPGVVGPGKDPIEFEGGEYIHKVDAVNYYGEDFMRKVNTMQFKKGDRFKRGGRIRQRRFQRGGMSNNCPSGQHWMPAANGQSGYCMQGATHPAGGYSRGGRTIQSNMIYENGGNTYPSANNKFIKTRANSANDIIKRNQILSDINTESKNPCPQGQKLVNNVCRGIGNNPFK